MAQKRKNNVPKCNTMKQKSRFKQTKEHGSFEVSSAMKQTEIGMNQDYSLKEIGTGAKVFSGFAFKSTDLNDEEGIPVVKIGNIHNRKVTLEGSQFFSEELINDKLDKFFLEDRDVLIAMTGQGSVGRVGQIRINGEKALLNQRVGKFIVDGKNLDRDYLYFVISSPKYEKILFDAGSGSGQPNLSPNQILSVEIPLPRIEIQTQISDILRSLNDKIHLNQQMNKTFEAIGQAIFKKWFIDFEFPNEKGKPYKSSGGEMVDSEMGEIPKGWKVGKIGDCMEFAYGKGLPETKRQEGSFPVLGSNGIIGFHSDYLIKGPGIVIGRKGTLGEVYWIEKNFFPIDTTFYIIDKMKVGSLYFHYFILKGKEFLKSSSDSAVPGLNRNGAYSQSIIIPSEAIISKFNVFCQCLFNKKNILSVQSNELSQIRDSLLPKLMSGKIRVPVEVKA